MPRNGMLRSISIFLNEISQLYYARMMNWFPKPYRISSDSTENILRHTNTSTLSEKFQIRFLGTFSIYFCLRGVRLYNSCNKKALIKVSISVKTSLFVKQTSCCLKTSFYLRYLTRLTAFFSDRSKNLSIGKYSQRGIIFNIDSMIYRIHHTANDKILSFSIKNS